MGEVAVIYKVIPNLEKKDEVKNKLVEIGAQEVKEESIGFGIVAFKAIFVVKDEAGKVEELENKIEKIEGVNSIQVEGTSLL
jgi:translation elongation factor EF-1beta